MNTIEKIKLLEPATTIVVREDNNPTSFLDEVYNNYIALTNILNETYNPQ